MRILSVMDFIMVPLWLIVIYAGANVIKKIRYANDPSGVYFLPGLTLKIIGGIMLGIIYQYYYESGDTISYYRASKAIVNAFFTNFSDGIKLFFADPKALSYETLQLSRQYTDDYSLIPFIVDFRSYNVSRIITIPNFLSLNSYYASSIILSSFSFVGVWGFFRVFYRQFPGAMHQLAVAFFFVPSIFFWGSGLLKDSCTMGLLGGCIYSLYIFMRSGFKALSYIIVAIICSVGVFVIKPYILLSLIPFLAIWFNNEIKANLKKGILEYSVTPFLLIVSLVVSYFAIDSISEFSGQFSVEKLLETAVVVKSDLTRGYYYQDEKGSSYDIGTFDDSFTSQLALFPNAVITTFFRPYLWEIRNPLMVFAAIESTVILGIFLYVVLRVGILNIIVIAQKVPFLIFTLGYSLSFAFMIGLTSGNFGNLIRYKIPCIPFFLASLFIFEYVYRTNRGRSRKNFTR